MYFKQNKQKKTDIVKVTVDLHFRTKETTLFAGRDSVILTKSLVDSLLSSHLILSMI